MGFAKTYVQAGSHLMIAIFLLAFTMSDSYELSIIYLICFGFFCMIAEGSTYGCVHCVGHGITSSVVGLVGSFGTFGAVMWGIMYAQIDDYEKTHILICVIIAFSAFGSLFLKLSVKADSKKMENKDIDVAGQDIFKTSSITII